ncbi:metallophosphoesterase [Shewanella gelidii]|uniref:Response regulatory domain-containing protein n=1 Tax=Shewanella gelidii TaxID=1642821 RepID=A0A917JMC9_9GAMM|nr:metallophosphoesterase [Shewanella gelidii]MCL1097128.1 metallophosphoesterase [Shewanella gelidii]GGI72732.1 hypothetical protein GCM10009332_07740 [Shewanella gelidii]
MKILVIDDEHENRKPVYQNLEDDWGFDNISINYLTEERVKKIDSENLDEYDLILLDIVFEKWNIDSRYAAERIRKVSQTIPIVLITGYWAATNSKYIRDLSTAFDTEKVPIQFTDLMTDAQKEQAKNSDDSCSLNISDVDTYQDIARILYAISVDSTTKVSLGKESEDSVWIMHISDLQLGGNTVPQFLAEIDAIKKAVRRQIGSFPDFVAVTGDISESGCPKEYEVAGEWLKRLCQSFKWIEPYERLLMVPGNHDVFLPQLAVQKARFISKREAKKEQIEPGINYCEKTLDHDWSTHLALYNYKNFSDKITGRNIYESRDDLCWVDKNYSGLGCVFVGLNSVSAVSYEQPFIGLPVQSSYMELRDELSKLEDTEGLFTICLAHHPKIKESPLYSAFSAGYPGPNLLLSGHMHKHDVVQGNNQLNITTTTVSLESKDRWEDVPRGFTLIELVRSEGKVSSVRVIPFEKTSRWKIDFEELYDLRRNKDGNLDFFKSDN